jgi:hypothetical protein
MRRIFIALILVAATIGMAACTSGGCSTCGG